MAAAVGRLTFSAPLSTRYKAYARALVGSLAIATIATSLVAQSGNRPLASASGGVMVNVVARREDSKATPITSRELSVYDNGVEQAIRNFTPDPSPAHIVLLVDNSLTIRAD